MDSPNYLTRIDYLRMILTSYLFYLFLSLSELWWDPTFQIIIGLNLIFKVFNFIFENLRCVLVRCFIYTYSSKFWKFLCYFLLGLVWLFFGSLVCVIYFCLHHFEVLKVYVTTTLTFELWNWSSKSCILTFGQTVLTQFWSIWNMQLNLIILRCLNNIYYNYSYT